ncbi:hypothetical protein [Alienimonas sp. DA493]|uniref:hypothetical protein n=1 Tax=Alienimonas sp. DA493 TaxID=3373605 RepID=UPI0037552879
MIFAGLFVVLLGGMWVLNWAAVVLLTGALGLRRRRWGTPGGGWALASAALHALAAVGIVVWLGLGTVVVGPAGDGAEALLMVSVAALLALLVAAHATLVPALWAAWRAADLATAGRGDVPADVAPLDAAPTGGPS